MEHVGKSTRQTPSTLPRLCLSLHTDGKLERGRPFRTNKDATSESIRMLIPSMTESGSFEYWFKYAECKITWETMIETLGKKTYRKYSNDNRHNRSYTRSRAQNSDPPPPSPPQQQRSNSEENTPPSPSQRTPLTRANSFRVLGIDKNVSRREIVMSFRLLSRRFHPDK